MGVKEISKKGVGNTTLYTLPHCTYCHTLKQALSNLKIPYKEIMLMKMSTWGIGLKET